MEIAVKRNVHYNPDAPELCASASDQCEYRTADALARGSDIVFRCTLFHTRLEGDYYTTRRCAECVAAVREAIENG